MLRSHMHASLQGARSSACMWCGYARGGIEEIQALEDVRIDAADGSLDGTLDYQKLRKVSQARSRRETDFDQKAIRLATDRAREAHDAKRRQGGVLPYFLIYDVVAAALSSGVVGLQIWHLGLTSCLLYTSPSPRD